VTETKRNVGDVVGVDDPKYPGRWEIIKINPKNWHLKPLENQHSRNLACPPWMFTEAPAPSAETTGAGTSLTIGQPYRERLVCGQIVTCRIPKIAGELLVVLVDKGDKVNCAPLFGDADRYRRLPPNTLTVVEPAELVSTLLLRVRTPNLGADERAHVDAVRELLADSEITKAISS